VQDAIIAGGGERVLGRCDALGIRAYKGIKALGEPAVDRRMVEKLDIANCCGKDLWPPTLSHQQPSQLHPFLSVEVQQSRRGSAFRRQPL
jgi:hypothetical protein